MNDLVSIIMPFYNAEHFLKNSINSVLEQDYPNWELLIVNDGSPDKGAEIVKSFSDQRIKLYEQENKGVSAARNLALSQMTGAFFCYLDADDILPPKSLRSRLEVFWNDPALSFVDGKVEKWNDDFSIKLGEWSPGIFGNPLEDLVKLGGHSFFGPTWMIRRSDQSYQMKEGLTHGEDLLFYMSLSRSEDARYGFTNDLILKYRVHKDSAMRNLEKLESGYRIIQKEIESWPEVLEKWRKQYNKRFHRILFLSYIRNLQFISAFRSLK